MFEQGSRVRAKRELDYGDKSYPAGSTGTVESSGNVTSQVTFDEDGATRIVGNADIELDN